jgi:hypothetical protein
MRSRLIGSGPKSFQVKNLHESKPGGPNPAAETNEFVSLPKADWLPVCDEFFHPEEGVDGCGAIVDTALWNMNGGKTNRGRITNRIIIWLCSYTICCLSRHRDNHILWADQGMESARPP